MKLGPSEIDPKPVRFICGQRKYRSALRQYYKGLIKWDDDALAPLRSQLRLELRRQLDGRCFYCRRKILLERRNVYESIEHFLDKSKSGYRCWAFSCVNLSIACHACNFQKSTRDMGVSVTKALFGLAYPKGKALFRWLHPCFDDFHENVEIGKGWTYTVKPTASAPAQAQLMIDECQLTSIERIEREAVRVKYVIERLTVLTNRAMRKRQIDRAIKLGEASERYQTENWYVR